MNSTDVLTVSQLTRAIKFNLESKFPFITVQGEISNFKVQTSGHLYFNIKDSEATLGAVMFRTEASSIKKMPKEGDQVILKGSLNVYPAQGKYQMVVKELELAGMGALLLKLEELKLKLHKLGYFKSERKKPIPLFPKVIGVVTSPTGAVIQDILHVLTRRSENFRLILNPVKVQGEGAALEIAKAIRQMNDYKLCDVMIVGRGGGSIEDLWAFNEEIVAQAIYESGIPIVAAIGHETDHTIACYVADVRAPTPSAAAEIVTKESDQIKKHFLQIKTRLTQALLSHLKHDKQKLNGYMRLPLFQSPSYLLGPYMQRIDHLREDIDDVMQRRLLQSHQKLDRIKKILEALNPKLRIVQTRSRLIEKAKSIDQALLFKLKNKEHKLTRIVEVLKALDPKNLLNKGYTIIFSEKDGSVIKSIHSIQINDKIKFLLSDGKAQAIITDKD